MQKHEHPQHFTFIYQQKYKKNFYFILEWWCKIKLYGLCKIFTKILFFKNVHMYEKKVFLLSCTKIKSITHSIIQELIKLTFIFVCSCTRMEDNKTKNKQIFQ